MSHTSLLTAVCTLMVLSAGTATGQASSGTQSAGAPPEQAIAPVAPTPSAPLRFDHTQVGASQLANTPTAESKAVATRDAFAAASLSSSRARTPGVVLMIVGGASVVTGLLIDESVFTILGAAVFLVGLYQYLRAT
jgi:hypothetical protein